MQMTRACWNIPDSFSTSTLLWITGVSVYQNVLLWGQLPSAFIAILMIFCVPVSGECRYFVAHHLNSQISLLHYLKILKNVFFRVKGEAFTQVFFFLFFFFTSEANGGAVFGLASRWRSFHGLLLPSSPHPHAPSPVPPLSVSCCPWWEDFLHKLHSTPQKENICWRFKRDGTERVKESFQGGLPFCCWITSLKSGSSCICVFSSEYMKVCVLSVNVIVTSCRHGYILCCELSSPGASTLPSSALPPPCLGRNGLLLWWGGCPKPLHAQVWEHCLQSYCGGIKCVRFPTWGLLHADWFNTLMPLLWCVRPRSEPQCQPPDRLPQEWGEHMVAEPVHVLWYPAPKFCQPHPAPG